MKIRINLFQKSQFCVILGRSILGIFSTDGGGGGFLHSLAIAVTSYNQFVDFVVKTNYLPVISP